MPMGRLQALPLLKVVILSILFPFGRPLVPSSFIYRSSSERQIDYSHSKLMATSSTNKNPPSTTTRRGWIMNSSCALLGLLTVGSSGIQAANAAEDDDDFFDDPEIQELYDNPALPKAPEERSGLTVLRVAEVAQFQEKILRAIASGELQGVQVSPMQFVFGTQILLKNSNLDGNMKLMIYEEIPRRNRKPAIKNAVKTMNTLQDISKYAGSIKRDFEIQEMVQLADMYREVRINLNQMYEYLPQTEKDKYYGYFVAVTEYEKKVAQGIYNPDIDGVLNFDD